MECSWGENQVPRQILQRAVRSLTGDRNAERRVIPDYVQNGKDAHSDRSRKVRRKRLVVDSRRYSVLGYLESLGRTGWLGLASIL